MQEAIEHPAVPSEETDALTAAALRAAAWAGEAFVHPDENPAEVLAEGRARRRALDDALAEMDAGRRAPSPGWKVRYALMLGLERVLTDHPPRLASGTELRRHQIDALAGMLTELISRHEEEAENGNGALLEEPVPEEEDEELEEEPRSAPGAARRFRFRHPTASGKTIAAAGFVESARTTGVLILTHRRLLVSQFTRDLTAEGCGDRLRPPITKGQEPLQGNPITIQTYAWFARHVDSLSRSAYHLVLADEAHTALGEKTSAAIRSFIEPIYIGMTATEQLIAKQVSDVFPASVDDLPLGDAARRGLIAPLRSLRGGPEGGGGERADAARPVGGDARRLRAGRDQRPHQRSAARRGVELAAGDRVHASRPDGEPARLPAAHRPHHAAPAPEGGGRRRRLRGRRGHAQRAHDHHPQPPRLGLLPPGRARHAGPAPARAAPRPPQALTRALAGPGHARRPPPGRGDHAGVGARRPEPPRRGRAAPLGQDRRSPGSLRGTPAVRREARQGEPRVPGGVPHELCGREPEPAAAPLRPRGPRRRDRRPGRLRRPRHNGDLGSDVGQGPRSRRAHAPAGDRRRESAGARGHPLALDVAARPRDPQAPGPTGQRRPARGEAPPG